MYIFMRCVRDYVCNIALRSLLSHCSLLLLLLLLLLLPFLCHYLRRTLLCRCHDSPALRLTLPLHLRQLLRLHRLALYRLLVQWLLLLLLLLLMMMIHLLLLWRHLQHCAILLWLCRQLHELLLLLLLHHRLLKLRRGVHHPSLLLLLLLLLRVHQRRPLLRLRPSRV